MVRISRSTKTLPAYLAENYDDETTFYLLYDGEGRVI